MNRPQATTSRAARAAFFLFAAALVLGLAFDATRAEASLPRSADAAALDAAATHPPTSRAVTRELVIDDALERAPDHAPRLGFAEDLCLLELDHARAGFAIFGRETRRCERTYARNNPLKYVDPDGRAPDKPGLLQRTMGWAEAAVARVFGVIDTTSRDLFTPSNGVVRADDGGARALSDPSVRNSPDQVQRLLSPGNAVRDGFADANATLVSELTKQVASGLFVAGTGRAVEFVGGTISESGFLKTAQEYLGAGSREVSAGRFVSKDGLRQVRFGTHEVKGPGLHAHFEAYDKAGGHVIENTRVIIVKDDPLLR